MSVVCCAGDEVANWTSFLNQPVEQAGDPWVDRHGAISRRRFVIRFHKSNAGVRINTGVVLAKLRCSLDAGAAVNSNFYFRSQSAVAVGGCGRLVLREPTPIVFDFPELAVDGSRRQSRIAFGVDKTVDRCLYLLSFYLLDRFPDGFVKLFDRRQCLRSAFGFHRSRQGRGVTRDPIGSLSRGLAARQEAKGGVDIVASSRISLAREQVTAEQLAERYRAERQSDPERAEITRSGSDRIGGGSVATEGGVTAARCDLV
jgi:hypothetical protein